MRKSFIEYVTSLGRWGWVVLVDILSGIAGAYLDVSGTWGFPTWLWTSLFGIAFLIAPFLTFHKVRKERDEAKGNVDSIILALESDKILVKSQSINMSYLFLKTGDSFVNGIDSTSIFSSVGSILPGGSNTEWNEAAYHLMTILRKLELIHDELRTYLSKGYVLTLTTSLGNRVLRILEERQSKM